MKTKTMIDEFTNLIKEKPMKKQLQFIRTFTLAMVMFLPVQGFAQELKPGDVLPELTLEEKAGRLAGNFLAVHFGILSYATMHGQSIEEVGRSFGKMMATSWPESATPEFFVTAMNRNWQMFDLRTEVLEVGDDYVKARVDKFQMSDEAETWYQERFGHGVSDLLTFFQVLEKEIISELGLEIAHSAEGEHVVFTVSVSK